MSAAPFTFGVALIARQAARDWSRVERLFDLTLTSILAQTDPDFRVLVAGHDRPAGIDRDPRTEFLAADWPVQAPDSANLDSWRKKHAINEAVLGRGGGLLMFVDADDWIDRDMVRTARAATGIEHVGAVVGGGHAVDACNLAAAALPDPRIFAGDLHRVCGSCGIVCIRPGEADPLRRDPYKILHDHSLWPETAAAHGALLARLDTAVAYLINTSENHSELHGPFTDWRKGFRQAVARYGDRLDEPLAARFGLNLIQIRDALSEAR